LNLSNKNKGNIGEAIATNWLVHKNYTILHNNWRYKQTEVDIIATQNNCLHFVEVKPEPIQNLDCQKKALPQQK
jgi:putative endonuclease